MAVKAKSPIGTARERILDAAQRLFSEHGSEAVTMAQVAQLAGVARATVFNQFGSKHAVIEGITQNVFGGYRAILDNALADRVTPAPVLIRSLFEVMGLGIEDDKHFYRAVFREIARITVGLEEGGVAQEARQSAIEGLVQLLTRGQARKELTTEHAPEDLAVAFDSLVFGTITHWLYDDGSEALSQRMLRAADVFLGSVATDAGAVYEGPLPDLSDFRAQRSVRRQATASARTRVRRPASKGRKRR